MSEKFKYIKNDYGHYRIAIDGLEFNSLRQAKVHIKNKRARARRRLNGWFKKFNTRKTLRDV